MIAMFCVPKRNNEKNGKKIIGKTQKLLLLGSGESGKTTIIKQMRILHTNGFSVEEKKEKIPFILQNIHESIHDIVYNMDKLKPTIQISRPEIQISVEFLLNSVLEPQYDDEYFDHVKRLWSDSSVQEVFRRSNEYQLIDSAAYFLNKIDEIRKEDYIPSTQDILFCRIKTTSISEIKFQVQVPKMYGGGMVHFSMYDVGGQRGHRKKWIQVFDGIEAVLFLIAASDFDLTLREDSSRNRLEESLALFQDIYRSRFLRNAGLIVFLNKQDLLKRKVENGHNIEKYFTNYSKFHNLNQNAFHSEYEIVREFIKQQILDISSAPLTVEYVGFIPGVGLHEKLPGRTVYIHFTTATDTHNIKLVFESVHEIILKKNIDQILY